MAESFPSLVTVAYADMMDPHRRGKTQRYELVVSLSCVGYRCKFGTTVVGVAVTRSKDEHVRRNP